MLSIIQNVSRNIKLISTNNGLPLEERIVHFITDRFNDEMLSNKISTKLHVYPNKNNKNFKVPDKIKREENMYSPMMYSSSRFHPMIKAINSPTVT